jgi:hypothetical protein
MAWYRSKSKYGNIKTQIGDITFDSRKEANRYEELRLLERAGQISSLQRQVHFEIIPEYREPDTIGSRGGLHKGKLIQSKYEYVADFVYIEDGKKIVEDVKSPATRTPVYRIKKALMYDRYRIRIRET